MSHRKNSILVYVAGPYSHVDSNENVHRAIQMGHTLMDMGYTPFIPHLSALSHIVRPRPYQEWLNMDLVILKRCDVLVCLPGKSHGAAQEVEMAQEWGIPCILVGAIDPGSWKAYLVHTLDQMAPRLTQPSFLPQG